MTRSEAIRLLQLENPRARPDEVAVYVDAWTTYREAAQNIETNGAVCKHPRTGAPLVNPYLEVREDAARQMRAVKGVRNVEALWDAGGLEGPAG